MEKLTALLHDLLGSDHSPAFLGFLLHLFHKKEVQKGNRGQGEVLGDNFPYEAIYQISHSKRPN